MIAKFQLIAGLCILAAFVSCTARNGVDVGMNFRIPFDGRNGFVVSYRVAPLG